MRIDGVYLQSLGVYLPRAVTVDDGAPGPAQRVYDITGWRGMHVADDMPALDMAILAAREALSRCGTDGAKIDSIIHAAAHYQGPSSASSPGYLLREMEMDDIPSLEIRQGCTSVLGAVQVAASYITGAPRFSQVLVTSSENFSSPLIDRYQVLGPGSIASDGAAAAVVTGNGGFAEVIAINSATMSELEALHRGGGSMLPPQERILPEFDVRVSTEHFFAENMPYPEVIKRVSAFGLDLMHRSLAEAGIDAADLTKLIFQNVDGRLVLDWFMKPLGLPMSRSSWAIGCTIGHVGGCDHLISLDRMLSAGELKPGDHVMLFATGPGWISTAVVLRIVAQPAWLS